MNLKNPYVGVDAHLNSLLQTPGTVEQPAIWPTFHFSFVANMVNALNTQLPANYIAFGEQSLQSRGPDVAGGAMVTYTRPNATVFRQQAPQPSIETSTQAIPIATWEVALAESLEPDDTMTAVIVRRVLQQRSLGEPVLRIELLSPANKPGGSSYTAYRIKRREYINTQIPFIEIDLLHEQLSPIIGAPRYPHDALATPYYVALIEPQPNVEAGRVRGWGFRIGEPVATVPLPLADDKDINFDLDAVYQYTYEIGRWRLQVDHTQLPVRFETYGATEQAAIRTVMSQLSEDVS